jgi:hypothetical protein
MSSSWLLRRVSLVRRDVSEEHMAYIIKVKRIGELKTTLVVTSNFEYLCSLLQFPVTFNVFLRSQVIFILMMEVIHPSETRHHIPEDTILHSHRRENLKSYIVLIGWAL